MSSWSQPSDTCRAAEWKMFRRHTISVNMSPKIFLWLTYHHDPKCWFCSGRTLRTRDKDHKVEKQKIVIFSYFGEHGIQFAKKFTNQWGSVYNWSTNKISTTDSSTHFFIYNSPLKKKKKTFAHNPCASWLNLLNIIKYGTTNIGMECLQPKRSWI